MALLREAQSWAAGSRQLADPFTGL